MRNDAETPHLLLAAQEQIVKYAEQGREPDLARLERLATEKIYRNLEPGRLLINSFVVIGLMGTLFALFQVGHDARTLQGQGPQDVLNRMSIAFSASFFGLLWALICNLFFMRALRRRATQATQEVGHRLSEFSAINQPKPTTAFEQAARGLNQSVELLVDVIARLELREETGLKASQQILQGFRDTTNTVISNLAKEVKVAQAQSAKTAAELKSGISSSLEDLKKRFVEISETWRTDLEKTINASEGAAQRLATSSENLVAATADVSTSLSAVQQSLQKTEALAEIVTKVEHLTADYLVKTGELMDHFKKGLDVTVEVSRSIPDEWFTMLGKRNAELTEHLSETTSTWQEHVTNTTEELATRFEKINQDTEALSALLSPEGTLTKILAQIQDSVCNTPEWIDYKSQADLNVQLDALVCAVEKLDGALGRFEPVTAGNSVPDREDPHLLLTHVTEIKDLLKELVSSNGSRSIVRAVPQERLESDRAPLAKTEVTKSIAVKRSSTNDANGLAMLTEKVDEIIVILNSKKRETLNPAPINRKEALVPSSEKGVRAWIRRRVRHNKDKL
ncbi:MAG TPA: MotA/TolQ/ExbB proton channel family protein [Pyrinomonadaceae bacterium]|nr:MotA/TolQ/ExbB proton channel family protein [Pyrinomonadaceae bacterium]